MASESLPPESLKAQAVNARFMKAPQMAQLVDNVKRDGVLTSALLGYRDPDGDGSVEILSGHHRAEAARKAGLAAVDVMVITSKLDEQRKTAIQLSHNAIVGEDDPTTLAAMYASLDLSAKSYSGLDDDLVGDLKSLNLGAVSIGVKYQEVTLFFLSEDSDLLARVLPTIEKWAKKDVAFVARYEDFARFFEAVVRVKSQRGVYNSALAMRALCDLAMKAMDAEDRAGGGEEAKT